MNLVPRNRIHRIQGLEDQVDRLIIVIQKLEKRIAHLEKQLENSNVALTDARMRLNRLDPQPSISNSTVSYHPPSDKPTINAVLGRYALQADTTFKILNALFANQDNQAIEMLGQEAGITVKEAMESINTLKSLIYDE